MSEQPPRREIVTRPTRTTAGRGPVEAGRDIDEQTPLGETFMSSLLRTQLRLGLSVLALVLIPLAILPAAWALAPGIGRLTIGPVPLPWIVLGVGVYPLLVLAGWRYVRQAERNEAEFERIVTRR
jgi:hypothetical protein